MEPGNQVGILKKVSEVALAHPNRPAQTWLQSFQASNRAKRLARQKAPPRVPLTLMLSYWAVGDTISEARRAATIRRNDWVERALGLMMLTLMIPTILPFRLAYTGIRYGILANLSKFWYGKPT